MQTDDERTQLESFLETYRASLPATLDGMDEEQARRRLVPSKTTLLALLKHLTFVEAFWFQHAVTGTPLKELGVASSVARSWNLTRADTIADVRATHGRIVLASKEVAADRPLDEVVTGRGSAVSMRFMHLQVLKEYAHHSGHADILREQILAA